MKLQLVLLTLTGLFLSACNPTDKQIEEWVKKNPEKIIQALMEHQKAQQEANSPKPEMVKENAKDLFEHTSSPRAGSGKIKIAYFFDFNCGHCARQSETIKQVLAANKDVEVIYKNLPVLGPSSELSARAALSAHQQNKFHEFYTELYKTREKNPDSLKKIASKLGLDVKKWEKDMESEAVNNEITHVQTLAGKMKLNGTPAIAIAPDKIFPGRVDHLADLVKSVQ